jgi:hypothetical protein
MLLLSHRRILADFLYGIQDGLIYRIQQKNIMLQFVLAFSVFLLDY